jgi:hypothetical protein
VQPILPVLTETPWQGVIPQKGSCAFQISLHIPSEAGQVLEPLLAVNQYTLGSTKEGFHLHRDAVISSEDDLTYLPSDLWVRFQASDRLSNRLLYHREIAAGVA